MKRINYVLKNKNTGCYLKYIKRIRFKHYIVNVSEADKYNKSEAEKMLKRFKHPENWEIIKCYNIQYY